MKKGAPPSKPREVDIARPVVEHLGQKGWEVYQEVETLFGVADIIAVLDNKLWIVEVKNSLSLSLLAQAHRWIGRAHWVSIAIPTRSKALPNTKSRRFAMKLLDDIGIGTFVVDFSMITNVHVSDYLSVRPHMFRRPNICAIRFIRDNLKSQQKHFAEAGSKGGAHWTKYKGSCIHIKLFVRQNEGCLVKELTDKLGKLHYSNTSSARHSISAMARGGHVPGVVAKTVDGKLRLFAEGS